MSYKNIAGSFFWISHKARVCQTDRRTDITTPKTALA